jgi:dienelactone hydrolase
MKVIPLLAGFLLLLLALEGVAGARGDELVTVAPHRAAAASGNRDSMSPLLAFLTRPSGPGRFPAVVLLHGCYGFDGHDTAAASTLKAWGYVGLALDSLGDANMCGGGQPALGVVAEVLDAYAALRYLTAQSFVASNRVAVMGYSMGGAASLMAVERGGVAHAEQASFRATVAYYPTCEGSSGILTAPALILVGERDDWTPAAPCRKLAAHESDIGVTRDPATGTPIDLVVYPDATHAFDYRFPPTRYMGHFIQYDEVAARDAETQVRVFLRRVLGDQVEPP